MSNIYDALNKGKAKKPADSGAPEAPLAEPPAADPRPAGESRSIPVAEPAPLAPSTRRPLGKIGDIVADDDLDVLRQRIMLELGSTGPQVVVFIGAVPGEGTSTVALRFARGVALSEPRRVLLVDGDMGGSRAGLSGVLEGAPEANGSRPGLSDLLAGNAGLPGLVLGTEQQNLHFLPFGNSGAPNLELVRNERVAAALREMTRHYSFIVIDAGASLAAPETALLASSAGGVVLVVRANRTRREVVLKGLAALNRAGCRLLGVVLNDRRYPIPGFLYRRL